MDDHDMFDPTFLGTDSDLGDEEEENGMLVEEEKEEEKEEEEDKEEEDMPWAEVLGAGAGDVFSVFDDAPEQSTSPGSARELCNNGGSYGSSNPSSIDSRDPTEGDVSVQLPAPHDKKGGIRQRRRKLLFAGALLVAGAAACGILFFSGVWGGGADGSNSLGALPTTGSTGIPDAGNDEFLPDDNVSPPLETVAPATPAPSPVPTPAPTPPLSSCWRANAECFESEASWRAEGGDIFIQHGNVSSLVHIQGISWYGFETGDRIVQGLWYVTIEEMLDTLMEMGFNALRIPLSLDLALHPTTLVNSDCIECEKGDTSWYYLEKLMDECAKRGMFVTLGMHSLLPGRNEGLWYEVNKNAKKSYSEVDLIEGWVAILSALKDKPSLMALDIYNEPHEASWALGNDDTDWGLAAERITEGIHEAHPDYRGLILIQGVAEYASTPYPPADRYNHWWGGNFEGIYEQPITLHGPAKAWQERVVYSPRVYGPSLYSQDYFTKRAGFPDNLPALWDLQLGFIEAQGFGTVLIGEWGGTYKGDDKIWADTLANYLDANGLRDTFFWAVNPDSELTGGLFESDWKTPIKGKVGLIHKIQPNPSRFPKMSKRCTCIANVELDTLGL
jgi:aryl-phospho-beta-D-glucosidase BglC (GH1 family)